MPLFKGGYGHRIRHDPYERGAFVVSWRIDTKHGRIRFPHSRSRDVNRRGAERFAKKWNINMPPETAESLTIAMLETLRDFAQLVGDAATAKLATAALTVGRDTGKRQNAAKASCAVIINDARTRGKVAP